VIWIPLFLYCCGTCLKSKFPSRKYLHFIWWIGIPWFLWAKISQAIKKSSFTYFLPRSSGVVWCYGEVLIADTLRSVIVTSFGWMDKGFFFGFVLYRDTHWRTQGGRPPPPLVPPWLKNVALKCPFEWRKREGVSYWCSYNGLNMTMCPHSWKTSC